MVPTLARLVLKEGRMEYTTFIMQQKGGGGTSANHRPEEKQFGLFDGVLLVGFLASFVGLVLFLAK